MMAICRLRRLMVDASAATSMARGLIGGVLALLFGLAFLKIGPHLAELVAGIAQSLGIKSAG
jgi:hypothetical protein